MTRKAKITYNPTEDRYEIHTNTGNGWQFESAYNLLPNYKDPSGETCMVSYQAIIKLAELENLGYSVTFQYL